MNNDKIVMTCVICEQIKFVPKKLVQWVTSNGAGLFKCKDCYLEHKEMLGEAFKERVEFDTISMSTQVSEADLQMEMHIPTVAPYQRFRKGEVRHCPVCTHKLGKPWYRVCSSFKCRAPQPIY